MKLDKKKIEQIREELEFCKKPLFFFHDDADGVSSFLLMYKHLNLGNGVIVKSHPSVDSKFIKKVKEYEPDKIFVLDLSNVEQEFIDETKKKIIWIDHHEPQKRHNVIYLNPRNTDPHYSPAASRICYEIVKENLWIAMCGIVGDWQLPEDIAKEFREMYPDLLPEEANTPEKALFETDIGRLAKIFNFSLKGKTQDAMKCVKILSRIETPYELLNGESSQAKYILKKIKKTEEEYDELLKKIEEKQKKNKSNLIVHIYTSKNNSITGEISNELLYRNPEKVIIIAREKSGEMKTSLRSGKNILIAPILQKILAEVEGYGGGHEHACGACIKKDDWPKFITLMENEVNKMLKKEQGGKK